MNTMIATRGNSGDRSISDLQVMAKAVAQSRLFPGIENEQAALTLMLLCEAEGMHPIQAIRRFHIIKGRPSMRADAMQAEFQRQGGVIRWEQSDARACIARFVHPTHAPEPGVSIALTMDQARAYGLTANELYKKYPDQMLRARVISQGVRMVLPGVVVGIYTPEEIEASDDGPAPLPVEARVLEPGRAIEPPPTATRAEVNAAFRPAGAGPEVPGRPPHDREAVKFAGDRIGARGLDVRAWRHLIEQEVAAVNSALADFLVARDLEPAEAASLPRAINHVASWAEGEGVEIPSKVNKEGRAVRAELGKVNARLEEVYANEQWRDLLRGELARYLAAKAGDARQVAENQAFGDRPPEDGQPVASGLEADLEIFAEGRE